MSRDFILLFLLILLAVFASNLYADNSVGLATGNLTTADACGFGLGYTGLYAGYGGDAAVVFGAVTYGFSDYTEGRIKFGFSDLDGAGTDPEILLGFDLKYKLMDYYDKMHNYPCDLALSTFIEYLNYEHAKMWEIGIGMIGSFPYRLNSGHRLIPYARGNLRIERSNQEGITPESDSNFRVGLNAGIKYELTSYINLYGEIQLDGNSGIFLGADFLTF